MSAEHDSGKHSHEQGPYRSATLVAPVGARRRSQVALGVFVGLAWTTAVGISMLRHRPAPVCISPPITHRMRSAPRVGAARLEVLTGVDGLLSVGGRLLARTTSGAFYESPSQEHGARHENTRFAMTRVNVADAGFIREWETTLGPWWEPRNGRLHPLIAPSEHSDLLQIGRDGLVRRINPFRSVNNLVQTRLPRSVEIAANEGTICAISIAGEVWCQPQESSPGWTLPPAHRTEPMPRRVAGLSHAHDLVMMTERACAVSDGALWCWFTHETIASITLAERSLVATRVEARLDPIARLVGHGDVVCAIQIDGGVRCVKLASYLTAPGDRGSAQHGVAPGESEHEIAAARGALDLAMTGDEGACALVPSGRLLCWGTTVRSVPSGAWRVRERFSAVEGLSNATQLAVANDHACARVGQRAACWGANEMRQIDDSGADGTIPRTVLGLPPIAQIGVSVQSSCAVDLNRHLWCWGFIGVGPALAGSPPLSMSPTEIHEAGEVATLAMGAHGACVTNAAGEVRCWRAGFYTLVDDIRRLQFSDAIHGVTPMGDTFCGFTPRNDVVCWRVNESSPMVGVMSSLGGVTSLIASTTDQVCGLRSDGEARCARLDAERDLQTSDGRPVRVPPETTAIALSNDAQIALRRNGHLRRLERGDDEPLLEGVTQVAVADGLICALHEDGTVSCAGRNDRGQLGDRSLSPHLPTEAVFVP